MGQSPRLHARQVGQTTVAESGIATIELPRVNHIAAVLFRLSGTLAVAVDATSVPAHSPAELINRLDIIADGKEVLATLPFRMAAWGNYARSFYEDATPPSGVTAAGSPYTFSQSASVDFANFNLVGSRARAKDTMLPAFAFTRLEARYVFGAVGDIITGGTTSLTSAVVDCSVLEVQEREADAAARVLTKKITHQRQTWTAAATNLRQELPIGNHIHRVTGLVTDDGEPNDADVDVVEFAVNRSDVRMRLNYEELRAMNAHALGVDVPTGFFVVDQATQGSLKSMADVRRGQATRAEIVVDVPAPAGTTGALDLAVEEIIGL